MAVSGRDLGNETPSLCRSSSVH